jgi:elongation factor Ts
MEASQVDINPKDVMKLRAKTGLGMMDCKAALIKANGDMTKAEEILKAEMKGKMDTRTERVTAEGRVSTAIKSGEAVIVEVRCETDFTSRNDDFQRMVSDVTELAMQAPVGDVAASDAITKRVDDVRITTGENMSFARGQHLKGEGFGSYIHHDGKRGAIIQIEGGTADAELLSGICMHVVAHVPTPIGVEEKDVPADVMKQVQAAAIEEAKASGKPEQIAQKIAEGKVRKYLEENTLLHQKFVKDPAGKLSVKDVLPNGVKIVRFVRYVLGG